MTMPKRSALLSISQHTNYCVTRAATVRTGADTISRWKAHYAFHGVRHLYITARTFTFCDKKFSKCLCKSNLYDFLPHANRVSPAYEKETGWAHFTAVSIPHQCLPPSKFNNTLPGAVFYLHLNLKETLNLTGMFWNIKIFQNIPISCIVTVHTDGHVCMQCIKSHLTVTCCLYNMISFRVTRVICTCTRSASIRVNQYLHISHVFQWALSNMCCWQYGTCAQHHLQAFL